MANSTPPPALAMAHRLWENQRFDEAIRKFNEAVRQAPNDPRVLIEASRALGRRYQIDRSLGLLERALKLAGRRPEVQHAVGEAYRILGRTAEAEACFRRACRLAASPTSQLELAKLLERRHALDEAESLAAGVLRAAQQTPAALLVRGRIERRRGQFDRSQATLRQAVAHAGNEVKMAAEAYGELAALYDGVGEYDDAWAAIVRCKQLQLPHSAAAWDAIQFVLGRCQRMLEELTPHHFARWQSAAPPEGGQRLALLTGFPRTGTTLLEQVLDAHPEVISAEEKEVFSAEIFPRLGGDRPPDAPIVEILESLSPEQLADARRTYLDAMQALVGEPIAGRLLLDKNPAMNMMIPPMRRVFPHLKLIVALRDPRDVVLSCFLRYLPVNPVSACYLTLERTADRYLLDMQAWLQLREMIDNWVEVRYEDVIEHLRGAASRVLASLELPWDDAVLAYRTRMTTSAVLSPTYESVAKPIYTTARGRWRHYERQLAPVLDRLAPLVDAFGYSE